MIRKLTLLASLLISIHGVAQDYQDYVVTIKGDTVKGVAKIFTYDVIDRINVGGGKEKYAFTAVQVKEVFMQREIYHPVRTEAGYFMMKLIKPGFVSIYRAHQPKGYVYDTPWLVKKSGEAIEVPNLSFKKIMTAFLVECVAVQEKIKTSALGRRDLDKIVEEFNQCTSDIAKRQHPSSPVELSGERYAPVIALQARLEKDTSLPGQKDALDIVRDISEKLRNNQTVPKYLVEGLKDQLKDAPQYQEDIEKVLAAINNQ